MANIRSVGTSWPGASGPASTSVGSAALASVMVWTFGATARLLRSPGVGFRRHGEIAGGLEDFLETGALGVHALEHVEERLRVGQRFGDGEDFENCCGCAHFFSLATCLASSAVRAVNRVLMTLACD